MSSSELQALFSNLRPRSVQSRTSTSPAPASVQRTASSTFTQNGLPSAPPQPLATVSSHYAASMPAQNQQSNGQASSNPTAQNLLNLLNFGGPAASASSKAPTSPGATYDRQQGSKSSLLASDLVARMISPQPDVPSARIQSPDLPSSSAQQPFQGIHNTKSETRTPNTQYERSGIGDAEDPRESFNEPYGLEDSKYQDLDDIKSEHVSENKSNAAATHNTGKPLFTYQNPFEALNASRSNTPRSAIPQNQNASFDFTPGSIPGLSSPTSISTRKKLTPKLPSQKSITSPQTEFAPIPALSGAQHVATPRRGSMQEPQSQAKEDDLEKEMQSHSLPVRSGALHGSKESLENAVDVASGNVDGADGSGEWEDADDSDKATSNRVVPVYNFPIKAFVSITLKLPEASEVGIREGSVMEISRLKKEFDQLDRSLAAATSKYITYASTKNGGMRIIRQDDGSDRHVFKYSHDRVFNVALCTPSMTGPPSDVQNILGTGVSGAVYYAAISREGNDLFEKDQLGEESLIFPPWPQGDENTAGGVLKTRAKRSSRHPEFFAIGRGKSIHIIWPSAALSSRYGVSQDSRVVDVDLFYQERPLCIQTGKAGKDFTFSEDDTMIVSLDKTGRLRFWDIRSLIDDSNATFANPMIVDQPVLSLSTASPAEKSWPTSVLFVDKSRPYIKGGALRYVLIGLRQNHTLQLWDIALGKAVQEISFPHENETDGICSVNYHPASGIVVVGHPTRNSIFFIHLSAPRYTLSSHLTQAAYVSRVASKDGDLPKPESTACMSGIREISFAERGDLRSVELLPIQKGSESTKSSDTSQSAGATLFELYIVHSKGVTCLAINKEDLGWNADSKVVHGIDAQKHGFLSAKELKLGSVVEEPIRSKSPVREAQPVSKSSKKKAKKAMQVSEETATSVEEVRQTIDGQLPANDIASSKSVNVVADEVPAPKESKKSKKKAAQNGDLTGSKQATRSASPQKPVSSQIDVKAGPRATEEATGSLFAPNSASNQIFNAELWSEEIQKVQENISAEFRTKFAALQKNISADRVSLDQSSLSRQEAILRLVSSSLSTNVEKSLSQIVTQQIQSEVLPKLQQIITNQIEAALSQQLQQILTKEISGNLPTAVSAALETTLLRSALPEKIADKLAVRSEKQIKDVVVKTLTPLCQGIAQSVAESANSTLMPQVTHQIQQLQHQRAADQLQIDKLNQAVQGMAKTLQAMSDSQVTFQDQILRERQRASRANESPQVEVSHQIPTMQPTPSSVEIAQPLPLKPRSRAELELDEISEMMSHGQYEEGTIKWLQSSQPVQLFDEVFVRYTPEYLASGISPLVAFSVAVTVANSLTTHLDRRLEWISIAFDAVDPLDPEMTDLAHHAPGLISAIIQKLESLYMTLAERRHDDPVLKIIPSLVKKAREMRDAFAVNNTSV